LKITLFSLELPRAWFNKFSYIVKLLDWNETRQIFSIFYIMLLLRNVFILWSTLH